MNSNKIAYYTQDFLNQMRQTGDPAAEQVVQQVFEGGQAKAVGQLMASLSKNSENLPEELPSIVKQFFHDYAQLPPWADEKRMQKGWRVFRLYAGEILTMLGYLSLPYCYAGEDGARVLAMSQRFYQDSLKRLVETGRFVLDVMEPQAFAPQGTGFTSILKVRLMHAAIRFHILQTKSWNMDWGVPINQEDMSATIIAFSWICVRGLRKMRHTLAASDAEAFLHLWGVIGYVMGVREELLADNGKEAFWLDKQITDRHFRKSEVGIALTKTLLDGFNQSPTGKNLQGFNESYMRFLLGDKVADMLEVPKGNWTQSLLNSFRLRNAFISILDRNSPRNKQFYERVRAAIDGEDVDFSLPMGLGV